MKNNNLFESNKNYWSNAVVKGALRYPEPHVIRFVKKNLPVNSQILDFGCGAGRDSLALTSEGYKMVAMDYNQAGLDILKEHNPNITTVCSSGLAVPAEENSFDAIIADGSLFNNSRSETLQLLQNLNRTLKTNGLMWANWRTKNDSLYGKGQELEKDYYLLSSREGSTYIFFDEEGLREIYKEAGFKVVSIDISGFTQNNKEIKNEWYLVVAQKI